MGRTWLAFQLRVFGLGLLQELHSDEMLAIRLVGIINRADARMISDPARTRFALEPLHRVAVLGQLFWQELEGHPPFDLGVLGLVDHTHPPTIGTTY